MDLRTITIRLVLCSLVFTVTRAVRADTPVGGFISTDTAWTLAQSPYVVTSSIGVIDGATLEIEPGVQVRFEPDKAFVVDTGTLVSRGTEASPIVFTANQGSGNRWAYVQFSDNAVDATFDGDGNYISGSILEYTTIEYAGSTEQAAVRAIHSSPYIHASTVQENAHKGIYAEFADGIRLMGSTIQDNGAEGVHARHSNTCILAGNTIGGNALRGVDIYACEDAHFIENIVKENDSGGVFLWGASNGTHLTCNTITGNSAVLGGGIRIHGTSWITFEGNVIADNTASEGGALYARISENVTFSGDDITGNHGDDADDVGGVLIRDSCNGWDLTGPADASNPDACVNLFGNDNFQFYNDNVFAGFDIDDPGNVDARFVYWGTTDETEIQAGIYDFFDDASKGLVFYDPYAIPEPATLALLALGGVGALLQGRRHGKR